MHGVTSVEEHQRLAEVETLRARIVELERRCDELDRLAHLDVLVPLPNRRGLMRSLERLISHHHRHGDEGALLFVDVDGLKTLNDTYGHEAGDAALIHIAERLVAGVRESDCVARLGGDEFAVLLERLGEPAVVETAARLVNDIAGDEFFFEGQPLPLSVAIGYTLLEDGDSAAAVIARADKAMYRVKTAAA